MAPECDHPYNIDLFVGGLVTVRDDALAEPIRTRVIIAAQFKRLKFGDRYFFTHAGPNGFTPNQLSELKKRTLDSIICDNTQQVLGPNVFLQPG